MALIKFMYSNEFISMDSFGQTCKQEKIVPPICNKLRLFWNGGFSKFPENVHYLRQPYVHYDIDYWCIAFISKRSSPISFLILSDFKQIN